MGKLNFGFIIGCVVLLGLNIFQFIFWNNTNNKLSESYTSEIAALEQTIAGYGDEVDVYTVSTAVKAGDEITSDNIETMKMYSSLMTDQFVTDTSTIVGRYFKIAVNPGTPIMNNMAMDEELDDTMRDKDIMLDSIPVGTKAGDYIDIRLSFPYGDDYVVMPHKRIYKLNGSTIKMHLTEYEWNLYLGAMVDYTLNREYGASIYGTKYIEPGLQQDAVAYYAIPDNVQKLINKNPNIIDKDGAQTASGWREELEELLLLFRTPEDTVESDSGKLASWKDEYQQAIEADRQANQSEEEQAAQEAAQAAEQAAQDDYWSDDTSGGTDATATDATATETTDTTATTTTTDGGTTQ